MPGSYFLGKGCYFVRKSKEHLYTQLSAEVLLLFIIFEKLIQSFCRAYLVLVRIFFKVGVDFSRNIAYQISNKRKNYETYCLAQFSDFPKRNTALESTKRLIQIVNSCNQSERKNIANSFCDKRNCMKRNG